MSDSPGVRRIGLSSQAARILQNAVKELKQNQFIKVNESKLVSEILIQFFKHYYQKEKEALEKKFFDQKAYLQDLINQSHSEQELMEKMSSYFGQAKKRGRRRKEAVENVQRD